MKLYYHPVSMTSRPLMFFVEDNQLDVELQLVDLMQGEHHQPPFVQLNPNRLVPVLEHGDFVLSESSAILKYLAEAFDLPSYPKELRSRARVNERMDWFNTQFYREYGYHLVYPQIFPHHQRPSETSQRETLEWGRERAVQAMQLLNDHLLGANAYVAGNDVSVADYLGAGLVTAGEHIGIDFERYPKVKAWLDRIKSRPAWAKTHEVHEGFKASLAGREFVSF